MLYGLISRFGLGFLFRCWVACDCVSCLVCRFGLGGLVGVVVGSFVIMWWDGLGFWWVWGFRGVWLWVYFVISRSDCGG